MEQGRNGRGKAWMEKEKRAVEARGVEREEERSGAGGEESRRNERERVKEKEREWKREGIESEEDRNTGVE
jgi:hypothetical protein